MKPLVLFTLFFAVVVTGLDNGLATTPPMGWIGWERFTCTTDCALFPDSCVSEWLYKEMIDRIAQDGFLELGYRYVNIDDCWASMSRDSEGNLVADPVRFPSGIKALADYAHSKGLLLGLYADLGTKTCGGYPGTLGNLRRDAWLFAQWGIDSLKVDGCNSDVSHFDRLYPELGKELIATGRKILYSCSWPYYVSVSLADVARSCNLWRMAGDVHDSWGSVVNILEFWEQHQKDVVAVQRPGAIADPDMLIIGNFGLSDDQARVQMSVWAVLGAPLYMSADLRKITPSQRAILQNREVIAVDQDPLAISGSRVKSENWVWWWAKRLSDGSTAVAIVNTYGFGNARRVVTALRDIGVNTNGAMLRDLWAHKDLGLKLGSFSSMVNPTGAVMLKVTPASVACRGTERAHAGDHVRVASARPSFTKNQQWTFNRELNIAGRFFSPPHFRH